MDTWPGKCTGAGGGGEEGAAGAGRTGVGGEAGHPQGTAGRGNCRRRLLLHVASTPEAWTCKRGMETSPDIRDLPALQRRVCFLPLGVAFRAQHDLPPSLPVPCPHRWGCFCSRSTAHAPGPLCILFPSHPLPCPITLLLCGRPMPSSVAACHSSGSHGHRSWAEPTLPPFLLRMDLRFIPFREGCCAQSGIAG